IYAHPQPASPDTRIIKNADGLPLATALDGTPASEFLIKPEEMARRKGLMQAACHKCHADSWVEGHWRRLENTIRTTNASTLAATKVLLEAWSQGYALGLAESGNIFDEFIERTWCDIWLFSANSVRFSSAMAGGGDYGVFADGRYQITRRLALMRDWLAVRKALGPKAP
ncbi:MAG: hydroxylamine oxidase, partial [Desulfovibrionaceae bacterium]|nr:hydroxylamine oxidase [Desulfovibrionaceae bacterium]